MILTPEEVLVIFLDVEHDGTSQLHFSEEVEITKNEENFALRLKLCDHVLLVGKEIVILVRIALHLLVCQVAIVV